MLGGGEDGGLRRLRSFSLAPFFSPPSQEVATRHGTIAAGNKLKDLTCIPWGLGKHPRSLKREKKKSYRLEMETRRMEGGEKGQWSRYICQSPFPDPNGEEGSVPLGEFCLYGSQLGDEIKKGPILYQVHFNKKIVYNNDNDSICLEPVNKLRRHEKSLSFTSNF